MLVDTHCHLGDRAFEADRAEVLGRAWEAEVGHVVVVGESRPATEVALGLAGEDGRVSVITGIHPHEARSWNEAAVDWLRRTLADPRVVALGETGLDYHYDHSPRDAQRRAFHEQLALAAELKLPAVIHAREADGDIAATLRNHPKVTAVLHSFSSGLDLLHSALAMGHYVSFSGMVTFRNWTLDEAVMEVPLDRLLLETDAPYLAPVPYRGKRNEPAFVRQVAARVAEVRGVTLEAIIAATGENARRLFGPRLGSA